jgi:hypothetical protein
MRSSVSVVSSYAWLILPLLLTVAGGIIQLLLRPMMSERTRQEIARNRVQQKIANESAMIAFQQSLNNINRGQ